MPAVTICIPTYNRASMLAFLLDGIRRQVTPDNAGRFRIIVSDNASDDETEATVREKTGDLPLRYVRRDRNHGSYDNFMHAFRLADTPYVVGVGDADMVAIGRLLEAVAGMEASPAVAAAYYPIHLINGVTGRSEGYFSPHARAGRFEKGRYAQALNFVLDGHIFPEVSIFRTSVVETFPPRTTSAYWYFVLLATLLAEHDVLFGAPTQTFYTFYNHHPAFTRGPGQVGRVETSNMWDTYRGGLEFMLAVARSTQTVDDSMLTILRAKIDHFVAQRQRTALDFNLEDGNYTFAYYLAKRLSLAKPSLLSGKLLEAIRVGGGVEQAFLAHAGGDRPRDAVLVGDWPPYFNDLLKRFGRSWLASESPDAPRIGWDAQAGRADAYAEPFMAQFRL